MVTAEATVEEPERRHDLHGVTLLHPGHRVAARHALGPLQELVLRVRHDDGGAGRAGGHVEFHQVLAINAVHLQRIRLAEVLLREERQLLQVVERLHVLRRTDPALLQAYAVEVVLPHALQRLLQALQLDLRVLVTTQRFRSSIPHAHGSF